MDTIDNFEAGKYYLVIPESGKTKLMICHSRQEAERLFSTHYESGQNCEWKGMWDGLAFVDKRPPVYLRNNYYFRILTEEYPIPITRKTREEALSTFRLYRQMARECRWIGRWDGEKFVERDTPET